MKLTLRLKFEIKKMTWISKAGMEMIGLIVYSNSKLKLETVTICHIFFRRRSFVLRIQSQESSGSDHCLKRKQALITD